mgnify:CR=1 FL=1
MHVFYTPDIQTHAELPEEEAAHAASIALKSVRLPTNAAW